MNYKNCIPIKKFSLRYRYFFYADSKKYLADQLFIRHKVRVWYLKEAYKPEEDFVFIFCKVRKRDVSKFLQAIEGLSNKMILLGYPNYCEELKKFPH